VLDWLRAAKLSGQVVATCAREGATRHRLLLIQISGYVDNEDRRLRQFGILAAGAVNKSIVIGGFPTCFEPPEEKVI
jgi:microcompartment protein CcmK/EutM